MEQLEKGLGLPMFSKFVYDRPVEVTIPAVNGIGTLRYTTDAQFKSVEGIAIQVRAANGEDAEALADLEFATDFKTQNVILLNAGFDLIFLATGIEVAPDDRFWNDIHGPAEGVLYSGNIRSTSANAALFPIRIKFLFKCLPLNRTVV